MGRRGTRSNVKRTALRKQLESIASNVRRRRIGLGLTQEQLSELTGFDVRFLSRIERGQVHMRIETLLRLAESLGVKPQTLLRASVLVPRRPGRPKTKRPSKKA
jgi:transcriptional regulator with XRE-family HTH domain